MVYILYSELTQKIDTLTHLLNRRSYESRLASLRGHAAVSYTHLTLPTNSRV